MENWTQEIKDDGTVIYHNPKAEEIISRVALQPAMDPIVPTDEDNLIALRTERTRRLANSDWTQLPDVPEATKTAWQTYRQALRDVTETYTSLEDVIWPTKP
tara:strand:+ start:2209 stop:2514 length:306 start_codon:yes stop_codon:yes gene_type:complete